VRSVHTIGYHADALGPATTVRNAAISVCSRAAHSRSASKTCPWAGDGSHANALAKPLSSSAVAVAEQADGAVR
jgi:hypothetical protein